jgi:hypothetical protein
LWRDGKHDWEDDAPMIARLVLLLAAGFALASCAGFGTCPGAGPCTGRAVASPYDLADQYVDAQGYPLPGWAQMKYGTEGGGNR